MMSRHDGGCRTTLSEIHAEEKVLESAAVAGESPLSESLFVRSGILSSAGHEKSCMNPAGPSAKAKYS